MDLSYYLLFGLFLSVLFVFLPTFLLLVVTCLYWALAFLWSIKLIDPFQFTTLQWVDALAIQIDFHIDGLSQIFVLLISGIGIFVFIYAYYYMQQYNSQARKLLALLQLFAISMLGIVVSNDLLLLFLCWEFTSISSYLLIQFNAEDAAANQAAFNSLFTSVFGSLVMLVGFIWLHHIHGTWSIQTILLGQTTQSLHESQSIFLLLLIGAITKSAQFPFYYWLTGAMKAPTPVSAYLHSATMVNAGIYLLARFHPAFSHLDLWYNMLSTIGLMTMSLSSVWSLMLDDLKSVLAYTTIFALGAMVYLLGGTSALPIEAFVIFLVFHGIYKAAAFMLVGTIDKEYHTRSLSEIKGIARKRPGLGSSALIIFGAMAGLPPFFGFTVKEMIFEAKLAAYSIANLYMGISILSSMFIAAASLRCLWYLYGNPNALKPTKSFTMGLFCASGLAILIILFSILEAQLGSLIQETMQAILPGTVSSYMNPNSIESFLLSLMTTVGGVVILFLSQIRKRHTLQWPEYLSLTRCFEQGIKYILSFGKILTRLTQGQSLSTQLRMLFISIVIIELLFMQQSLKEIVNVQVTFSMTHTLIAAALILSAFSLLVTHNILYNFISLGLIGFASSMFFIFQGAVDVAITQLLVEVLTIILLLISLKKEIQQPERVPSHNRALNALIASSFGFIITQVLWQIKTLPFNQSLQNYFYQNSLSKAYGNNIVNVILVDFRSLDTYGEAIVIIAAAVSVFTLIEKYFSNREKQHVNCS